MADFNLPNGLNGLAVAAKVRDRLHCRIPVIILTGDISTGALRDIASADCGQLNKPVRLDELSQVIQAALAAPHPVPSAREVRAPPDPQAQQQTVNFVVDDDDQIRAAVRSVLEDDGWSVEDFSSCQAFLDAYAPGRRSCLLIDAYLPQMSGLELLRRLSDDGHQMPTVMMTGNADVGMAVEAMKAGASDFIEKPIGREGLLACIERALEQPQDEGAILELRKAAASHLTGLTQRQKQIMEMVLAGHPSKNIAADLGISQRTVENHRAAVMKRTGVKSLPELARMAFAAAGGGA